jgi:SOS-response transcriptional repressor LexA
MTVKRKIGDQSDTGIPEAVKKLRKDVLNVDQKSFARLLGISQAIVSQWESGKYVPSPMALMAIGKLEGADRGWWAEQAGPSFARADEAVRPVAKIAKKADRTVGVRLFANPAGAGRGQWSDREDVVGEVRIPRDLCPNAEETACYRLAGDSMYPTIHDGALFAVDGGQKELRRLGGRIVAAWHNDLGGVVKRLRNHAGELWLASDNPLGDKYRLRDGWRIVGRVTWWIQTDDEGAD